MRNYLFVLVFTFVSSQLFGQTRTLGNFNEVSTQESISVTLKKGSKNSATISASGIDVREVLTEVSSGRLKIELEGTNYRNIDVDVVVTYSGELDGLYASSSGSIRIDEPIASKTRFKIDVSSSGDIEMDKLTAPSIDLEASSSGEIKVDIDTKRLNARASSSGELVVDGNAEESEIKVSSSGEFDGYSFETINADVSASSGGSIKLEVKENLRARASSGGSVRYNGNPKSVDSSSSSGGTIRG